MLASCGGVIGLALGAALAKVMGIAFEVELPVSPAYVVLSIVVSSLAGIVSGWYPARRASLMDPVVALGKE